MSIRSEQPDPGFPIILITGASGYIGGRLARALTEKNVMLRCLARRPEYLKQRVPPGTEVTAGDVLKADSLPPALSGIHTAYYLIHAMGTAGDFEAEDRRAAENFGAAARAGGVRRIIYLGGLIPAGSDLSPHLRSRQEVGNILRKSGVQIIEFRASVVIGSGSLSFEMIRTLTERLPIMIAPRWVAVPAQPIAIEDVTAYLVEALDGKFEGNRIFEIGGRDRISYGGIMREYARQRGLRRFIIPVPVLTPRLSSLWLGLITPIYARVGRKLIDSLRNQTVVQDESALEAFKVRPQGITQAIERALRNEDREHAETRWSDAVSAGSGRQPWGGVRYGGRIVDYRRADIARPAAEAFRPIRRIGGETGWYYGNVLWRLRGFLDLLIGGVGLRRGRRDRETLRPGEPLDFWRVDAYEPDRRLRLSAEMKLPGRAWLEFEVEGDGESSTIHQQAIFDPLGLAGLVYWYALYPLHNLIFRGMLRGIVAAAMRPQK